MSLRHLFGSKDLDELEQRRILLRERIGAESDGQLPSQRAFDLFPELWLRAEGRWIHRVVKTAHGNDSEWLVEPSERYDDPFELVDGEPGGWTYLCASILRRELHELGRTGAHAHWSSHRLCAELDARLDPAIPEDLRAEVIEDNTRVTVRFHSLHGGSLFLHEDRYRAEGFEHLSRDRVIVHGLSLSKASDS